MQPVRVVTHICNYSYLFFSKDPFSSKTCNGNGKGNGNRGEGKGQGIFLHVFTFFCISVGSSDTLFVSLWNDFLEEERNKRNTKVKEKRNEKKKESKASICNLFTFHRISHSNIYSCTVYVHCT